MRFRLRLLLIAALLVVACLAGAQSKTISPYAKNKVREALIEMLSENAFVPGVDFASLPSLFDQNKAKFDEARTEDEFRDATNSVLSKLGISHVVVLSPTQSEQRHSQATIGIGIRARYLAKDKQVEIVEVFDETPAKAAGLEPGDVIAKVNGEPLESSTQMLGREGEAVDLDVQKYKGKMVHLHIVRVKYSLVRPPTLEFPSPDVALLKIPTFDMTYSRDNVENLIDKASNAKSLIVDLRGNPGGAVINMIHLISVLTPAQTDIGTFVSKRLVRNYLKQNPDAKIDVVKIAQWTPEESADRIKTPTMRPAAFDGKLVVLTDAGSGSAAEIAAAALKENRGATLIGTKTAGKVLVSMLRELPMGFEVEFPVMDYVTLRGIRLEGNGLAPDIQVADPPVFRKDVKDEVVAQAIKFISDTAAKIAA
ncbi:MAG: PDZ domain-containing protein [Armatimonadetes bacterium]|nr:PDZ domain-containing protein [Armatimonadota bacterium]